MIPLEWEFIWTKVGQSHSFLVLFISSWRLTLPVGALYFSVKNYFNTSYSSGLLVTNSAFVNTNTSLFHLYFLRDSFARYRIPFCLFKKMLSAFKKKSFPLILVAIVSVEKVAVSLTTAPLKVIHLLPTPGCFKFFLSFLSSAVWV